ncbi:MAG: hypothetical protein ACAI35_09390 [Candidatus Methylacidiphilales bacterium]|nr:hypothetical protein [Candidatus Methylacidiphilales bacterium]
MTQYDASAMEIVAQDDEKFLVVLTVPFVNVRPARPRGKEGMVGLIVDLKQRTVSGLGFAPSLLKTFQFSPPVRATPEELEEVRKLAWPTQDAILNDPDVSVTLTDLNSVPRPLNEWRYSNPHHPAKVRWQEEAEMELRRQKADRDLEEEIRNVMRVAEEIERDKEKSPKPSKKHKKRP